MEDERRAVERRIERMHECEIERETELKKEINGLRIESNIKGGGWKGGDGR